jgi:ribosomal protein L18
VLQFNGTATKPRLSVFCSNRQLYAVLADDHNKKILFYGSTLQKSICGDPPCSTVVSRRLLPRLKFAFRWACVFELSLPRQEAARRVGEELVRACEELGISEISYDRNSFARGEKMMAFEVPVSQHGFLPR